MNFIAHLSVLIAACAAADESVVITPLGTIQGIVTDAARQFRGVPYATQPVGALRFEPPLPASPFSSTLMATQDPPGCIQICGEPPFVCPKTTSEACLFLNIFTPRASALTVPVPVLVFIHGGNFRDAFCGGDLYDGTSLANRTGIVVVSISYRLGALGFLFTGNDTAVDPYAITGNYGLLDQQQALRWIQGNIAPFGGDPARVTLSGQSAGAMSVAAHLTSPAAAGLFQAAILQSEPFALPFRPAAEAVGFSTAFANYSGCGGANAAIASGSTTISQCLRNASVASLLAAQVAMQKDIGAELSELLQFFMPFSPVYGVELLPAWPLTAIMAGAVMDVPIMMGTTSGEGTMFIYGGFPTPMSFPIYDLLIPLVFGLHAASILSDMYPVPSPVPADLRYLAANVTTAGIFKCPTRAAALALATNTRRTSPVYMYQYDHVLSWGADFWNNGTSECDNICCHGDDLPVEWYPDVSAIINATFTPDESALALRMQSYYSAFAKSFAPGDGTSATGAGTLPPLVWPEFNDTSRAAMLFQTPSSSVLHGAFDADCNLWDSVGYDFY